MDESYFETRMKTAAGYIYCGNRRAKLLEQTNVYLGSLQYSGTLTLSYTHMYSRNMNHKTRFPRQPLKTIVVLLSPIYKSSSTHQKYHMAVCVVLREKIKRNNKQARIRDLFVDLLQTSTSRILSQPPVLHHVKYIICFGIHPTISTRTYHGMVRFQSFSRRIN